ncbi:unnamed protein product [Rotaria sp. Silwood1]|nr:unnamed protein product [Rotaria sp. Silwood1]
MPEKSSLVAFLLTLIGTGICCGCLYYPLQATIERVNNVFETEYIDYDWIRILRLAIVFVLAIIGSFSLILFIVGSLATSATRHQIYTGFRSRLGGRIATGFFSVIVYILITYLVIYYVNISSFATPTTSGVTNTASPVLCLTPGTYGIPVPKHKPDVKVCQHRFFELCALTNYTPRYFAALIGSFFVVMGLIHFLCSLVANYAYIKDGRKLCHYEDAIREEIETSKLNRG